MYIKLYKYTLQLSIKKKSYIISNGLISKLGLTSKKNKTKFSCGAKF